MNERAINFDEYCGRKSNKIYFSVLFQISSAARGLKTEGSADP